VKRSHDPTTGDRRPADPRCRDASRRTDTGYATAEAAIVLPVLLTVLALAIWILVCVSGQLRCVDAARAAARDAARGDSAASVAAAARSIAPTGAQVQVHLLGRQVEVTVTARVQPFGAVLRLLPPMQLQARAVAEREEAPP